MTYIKVTYLACDYDDKFPIISADSFDNLKLALDDYCGTGEKNSGKCLGFTPYNTKYPDDYEGYYEYECCKNGNDWNSGTYIDKFRVYCVEFYPETKYDVVEKNNLKRNKMKNIHLIPTYNYAPLVHSTGRYGGYFKSEHYSPMKDMGDSYQNIYITSYEEIKEGDWILYCNSVYKALRINSNNRPVVKMSDGEFELSNWNKIILTTDKNLIKDDVQVIDDEFLQWFVQNPSCEEVEVVGDDCYYEIIIPKEEPKQIKCYCGHTTYCDCSPIDEITQETLEKAAHKMLMDYGIMSVGESINVLNVKKLMVLFAKEQQKRSYSEEEVRNLFRNYQYDSAQFAAIMEGDTDGKPTPTGWFEKFKKK